MSSMKERWSNLSFYEKLAVILTSPVTVPCVFSLGLFVVVLYAFIVGIEFLVGSSHKE